MVVSLKLVGVRSNTEALREHIATNQWYEIPLKHHHQAVSRSIMQQLMFERGQQIFAEGEPSHLTYRIIAGSVDITVETRDGEEKRIASLGPDDIFGEMGIIDDSPRSATAKAREQTACQAYTAEEVLDLLSSNPEEAIDLIRSLILRLRSANRKLASKGA